MACPIRFTAVLPARICSVLITLAILFAGARAADHDLNPRSLAGLDQIPDLSVSKDGRNVAFTRIRTELEADRRRPEIWVRAVDGGPAVRWTTAGHSPQWVGSALYYLSRRSGRQQVWRQVAAKAPPEPVTALPVSVGSFKVSPGGTHIALMTRLIPDCGGDLECSAEQSRELTEVRSYDRLFVRHRGQWLDGREGALLCGAVDKKPQASLRLVATLGEGNFDVSSDASQLTFIDEQRLVYAAQGLAARPGWSLNQDLWMAHCQEPEAPENLTQSNPAADATPIVGADGKFLYWLAQQNPIYESDRWRIMRRDLRSGTRREVNPGWDRSPRQLDISDDGSRLYAVADQLGHAILFEIDVFTGTTTALTQDGAVGAFATAGGALVIEHSRHDRPSELFSVRDASIDPLGQLQPRVDLPIAETFWFEGWKGQKVKARLLPPVGRVPQHRYPVVYLIHGGPQQSMGDRFSARWNPQVFAARGYAVLSVDYHGSTGYGQAFTASVSGDWAGKPLVDLQKGWAAAIERFPWLDPERACVAGGSYGGYMVQLIAGRWADAFDCAISHAGIFDLRAFRRTSDERWFVEQELGNDEAMAQQDPSSDAGRWTTPMLLTHGKNDYRVPVSQSIAAFIALQERDIDSRLMLFEDEGHSIRGPNNLVRWHEAMLFWLDHHLRPDARTTQQP